MFGSRLRRRTISSTLAATVTSLLCLASPATAQEKKTDIRIATGTPGGAYYVMGAVLADVLRRSGQFGGASAEASSGSIESARLIASGEVTLAGMDANWVKAAYLGKAPFKQKLDVRTVVPMGAWPLFFITLDSSPIKNVTDLKGKRVAVGARGSGMEQHARTVLGAIGMTFNDISPVYLAFGPGSAAVREGKADAQLQCCIPNAGLTQLTELSKTRVVSITPEQVAKVMAGEGVYDDGVLKKGAIKHLENDTPTLNILNGWIGMSTLPDETAYSIAKIFIAQLGDIASKAPQYVSVRDEMFARAKTRGASALEAGAPLHPGAARAFKEAGILK